MTAAHDSHRRHEIDLTVRLTEAPEAPEYVFRLAASGGALAEECTLPDSAAALAAVEQHGRTSSSPSPVHQDVHPTVRRPAGGCGDRLVPGPGGTSQFSRTDGCEIARWRAMAPLLGGISGSTGTI